MFKKQLLFVGITALLILSACGTDSTVNKQEPTSSNVSESNEIIHRYRNVENLKRLDGFVENITAKKSDEVKITHYTIEGDQIYDTVVYDGKELTITNDNTEDKFGSGEIYTYKCKNMTRSETETELEYVLEDCVAPDGGTGNHPIVSIGYNLAQEDYFAFRLEYGDGKNIIDTKNQKLVKGLQNGETSVVADFQFSDKEMQEIFKVMTLKGIFANKVTSTKCQDKPLDQYKLKVWINQGTIELDWDRCSESVDGDVRTEMVDQIFEILKKNEAYKGM
ncbi:DUF4362 domain-containing protein [Pseudoneobacillus sp. C159]